VPALRSSISTIDLLLNSLDTATCVQIRTIRAPHVNVLNRDILAYCRARTHKVPNQWLILLARRAAEILNRDIRDGQVGGKLVTQRNVLLAITLRDFYGVVDVGEDHGVVCDV
jgi:hypothetical protein